MLGKPQVRQPKFFYDFDLESRVPGDHPLRRIDALIDFSFARHLVAHCYGDRGNCSVDPAVTLKLLFLLFYENVASQRALLRELPMRLDWLWFCGFDLDDAVPDQSVLTKARRLWGRELFSQLFEQVVGMCVEAGLVDGTRVHVDSSTNAANASLDSLKLHLRVAGTEIFDALERDEDAAHQNTADQNTADQSVMDQDAGVACDSAPADSSAPIVSEDVSEAAPVDASPQTATPEPRPGQRISTTDPQARLAVKNGKTVLGYKDHRSIDDKHGIITATLTTHAGVDDAAMLLPTLAVHERTAEREVAVVVADKGYGHADVYQQLQEEGIKPCIPHKKVREDPTKLSRRLFVFDPAADVYTCPAGQTLSHRGNRYCAAANVCRACPLRESCTADREHGRQLRRHPRQEQIDQADATFSREHRRRLMSRRRQIAEGSFADAANRHGYKRHRWRGLEGAAIQNLLIGTIQNLRKLRRHGPCPRRSTNHSQPAARLRQPARNLALSNRPVRERRGREIA